MKRETLQYLVSILLILSIGTTAVLGYIQSRLELRRFLPHRYFAYTTLCLAALHVYLHWDKLLHFMGRIFHSREGPPGTSGPSSEE